MIEEVRDADFVSLVLGQGTRRRVLPFGQWDLIWVLREPEIDGVDLFFRVSLSCGWS
jgi:hypothetical protein